MANVDPLTRAESYLALPRLYIGDVVLVVGAAVALCGLIALLIMKSRHRRRKVKGGVKVFRGSASVLPGEAESSEERRRYKRRVRRRGHRQINPTLAETGGLEESPGERRFEQP